MSRDLKRFALLHALALATLTLSACSQPAPSREDLIGVWKADAGGVLILRANGTAEVRDAPIDVDFPKPRIPFSGRGTWSLAEPPGAREFLIFSRHVDVTIMSGDELIMGSPCYSSSPPAPRGLVKFIPPILLQSPSLQFENCDDGEFKYAFQKQ